MKKRCPLVVSPSILPPPLSPSSSPHTPSTQSFSLCYVLSFTLSPPQLRCYDIVKQVHYTAVIHTTSHLGSGIMNHAIGATKCMVNEAHLNNISSEGALKEYMWRHLQIFIRNYIYMNTKIIFEVH